MMTPTVNTKSTKFHNGIGNRFKPWTKHRHMTEERVSSSTLPSPYPFIERNFPTDLIFHSVPPKNNTPPEHWFFTKACCFFPYFSPSTKNKPQYKHIGAIYFCISLPEQLEAFKIQKFMILPTNFSEEAGFLTPTKKLKRPIVEKAFTSLWHRVLMRLMGSVTRVFGKKLGTFSSLRPEKHPAVTFMARLRKQIEQMYASKETYVRYKDWSPTRLTESQGGYQVLLPYLLRQPTFVRLLQPSNEKDFSVASL